MKTLLTAILLFSNLMLFAQRENIEQFLDDGGRTKSSTIIKTDIYQIVQSNINLNIEQRFNKHFAIQAGVGYLANEHYKPLIRPAFTDRPFNESLKGGYSILLYPLYYSYGFESMHLGFPLRYMRYSDQLSTFDLAFAIGYQWFSGRHLSFDIEIGAGLNFEYSLDNISYKYNKSIIDPEEANLYRSRIIVPISFKFGYVL